MSRYLKHASIIDTFQSSKFKTEAWAWNLEPGGTSFHGKYVSPDTRDYQGQQASKWHKKQAETSSYTITNLARFLSDVEVWPAGNNLRALEVSCSKIQARLP